MKYFRIKLLKMIKSLLSKMKNTNFQDYLNKP